MGLDKNVDYDIWRRAPSAPVSVTLVPQLVHDVVSARLLNQL